MSQAIDLRRPSLRSDLFRRIRTALFLVVACMATPWAAAKFEWAPVAPADLAATASTSAPGADMEILFARHRMDDDAYRTFTDHHIQAKIYTRKGIERTSVLSVEHEKDNKIWDFRARVVKPDGSFVELTKADFHENIRVKTGGVEILRTTFAFPNVQPGDVLEYHWVEEIPDKLGYYIQYCQSEDIPTREFVFDVAGSRRDFTVSWFNCQADPAQSKGHKVVLHNLAPFISEPLMPTETEFRAWIMIQFTGWYLRFYNNEDAWESIGEYIGEEFRLDIDPNGSVKAKAAELTRDAKTPEEKLAALYTFAQTSIRNLDSDDDPALAEAKKKRKDEDKFQAPSKTMSRRLGNSGDINRLFAGLARAEGFDVRLALNADRSRVLRIKVPRGWYFADRETVAVKLGQGWKFYAPGNHLVPAGLLDTKDEGASAFVCDEKKSWFAETQIASPEQSEVQRKGRFSLDEDGTLEGDVEIKSTGHRAVRARQSWWDLSADDATKLVRDDVVGRLSTAEVSDVKSDDLRDPSRPFTIHYHVRAPGYADLIGSRLAFPLNFFEANAPEIFTNETRRYPIFFDFPEEQHDDISLILPEGFALDGASAPAPVEKPNEVIHVGYRVGYAPKKRTLSYRRDYVLGQGGIIDFRAESYPTLRKIFDRIHRSDTHQLVLKPKTATAPSAAPATSPAASAAGSPAAASSAASAAAHVSASR